MEYTVYKHTNLHNGKVYIGITGQKPYRRWDNGRGYIGNKYFYRAIQKYGWSNFSHEILHRGLTLQEANIIEKSLIAEYDSANPQRGYNIELGGNGAGTVSPETKKKLSESHKGKKPWNKGIPHTEEAKQKMRLSQRGKHRSEETRINLSLSKMGEKNSFYGKHHTAESIKKNSMNQPTRKRVMCVETGIVYDSMAEASRKTGVTQGAISNVCRGYYERAGGFHWKVIELNTKE